METFHSPDPDGVLIEGVVRGPVSRASRGWVTYLGPWWAHATAQLLEVPLRVRMRELDDTGRGHLTQGATVRLRVLTFEPPRAGAHWWGSVGVPSTLQPVRIRPPVLVHDRMLRTLGLDRRGNAFVGRRGDRYTLRIERSARVADRGADRQEVARARAVVHRCEVQMRRIHDEVAARARRIYNRRWRLSRSAEERPQLSQEEVSRRLCLSSMRVARNGEVHLSFSDDDIFYSHSVNAILTGDLRLRLVTIGI